jgi:glutathione S-transferase
MTSKRLLVHTAATLLAPILVAWFGLSVAGAIALVLLLLAWRWAISLSGLVAPEKTPTLQLDTISASHFAEKVRWCMDRLQLEYTERQDAATLGVWFLGRTVPRLRIKSGAVVSSIGNSPEILRYLWGAYGTGNERGRFLEPTAERLELEHRLDRYGRNLQVWIYYHLPQEPDLLLHAWGVNSPLVPGWQKLLLKTLRPILTLLIQKSFRTTSDNCRRAVEHIEALLQDMDTRLAESPASLLGDDTINYTDIAFASLSGVWLQPQGYGAGKADAVRLEHDTLPEAMRADVERWTQDYPRATAFINELYERERKPQN